VFGGGCVALYWLLRSSAFYSAAWQHWHGLVLEVANWLLHHSYG
jgi:hypothetical protein